jgi:predicted secreted hydrolase
VSNGSGVVTHGVRAVPHADASTRRSGRARRSRLGGLPRVGAVLALGLVLAACSGPILANPPLPARGPATPIPTATPRPDPHPIRLPIDDGPHERLTEWWYFTGHLRSDDGRRFGFEAVIFRAERGSVPVTWASHLALTDESGGRFLYAQRSELGPEVDRSPRSENGVPKGFALAITGADPRDPSTAGRTPWVLEGAGPRATISGGLSAAEAVAAGGGFRLGLTLTEQRPPVLHDGDGFVDFGPAGGSYYYSRTRMGAAGTLVLDGETLAVDGSAWFDHQWGDFISVGGGGWDWFAVNLDDGTDVTLSLVRAADGSYPLAYGTLVRPGSTGDTDRLVGLDQSAFTVDRTAIWTSLRTGTTYPAGWRIGIPSEDLVVELTPTVADQELDTRATTGVVYWEGSQRVSATRAGETLGGQAYVELTGYTGATAPTASGEPRPSGAP